MGKSKKRSRKSDDEEPEESKDETAQQEEPKKSKIEDEPAKKKRSPDLSKFWKAVEEDPKDFTGWTYLLQFVDSSGEIDEGREAYDAFLLRYPYCYGYWKKYADLEKRKGSPEKCMEVFDRGMKAIPLSADLWIHYLNHVKKEFASKPDFVRSQYEKAVEACGKEWRSDKLWDHFVKWEIQTQKDDQSGGNFKNVLAIYDRILANPTQGLSHQFEVFKDFVKEHQPKEILEVDDFLALRKDVLKDLKRSDDDTESADAPGEDIVVNEEENIALREKIISSRKKIFKKTEEKVQLRWKFEDAIKRPYFHMKPLEKSQLKNWCDYLEFEETQMNKKGDNDHSNLIILYERCMIACALYEEFWMKYINWLLRSKPADFEEKVRNVYFRACTYHLPEKVDIHLNWAGFEEQHGNFDQAKNILTNLEEKHPELMSILLRKINLERRAGHLDEVHGLYKLCIEKAKTTEAKAELAVKYSRFLRLLNDDDNEAKSVLQSFLDNNDEKNAKIYMQLLDIELHAQPLCAEKVLKIFDAAIQTKAMKVKQKLLFSQRKIEFLEDFGKSILDIEKAKDNHETLTEEYKKELKAESEKSEKPIETIEGHFGRSKVKNGDASTTYVTSNTTSQSSNYDQYGQSYNYGNYGQYYQGYSQSY